MSTLFENEIMIIAGVFFLFCCILVLAFYLAVRQKSKLREYFSIFSAKLGCSATIPEGFFDGFPSINGNYRKRPLQVYMFKRSSGSGNNRRSTTYTAFKIPVDKTDGFEFHIYEQGFFTTLLTKLGMQDIQIGDEAFDKEFIVKSNQEEKVRTMLTPMIMSKFLELAERYVAFGVQFKGGQFYYEAAATITSEKTMMQFEEMINFMCDIADQLDQMNRRR